MERYRPVGIYQARSIPYGFHSFLTIICSFRAIFRFTLLRITRKPLLSPPIPERDFDPTTLPPSSNTSSPTLAPSSPSSSPPATPDHLRNNHSPLPSHALLSGSSQVRSNASVEEYLLPKAMTTSSVKPSLSLVQSLSSPQDWLAESIYILRPLVYGRRPYLEFRAILT